MNNITVQKSGQFIAVKMLKLFVVTLPFIALGVSFGVFAFSLPTFIMLLLSLIVFFEKPVIPYDNIYQTLYVFLGVILISSIYRMAVEYRSMLSITNETMYFKDMKQIVMFVIMIVHLVVLRRILSRYDISFLKKLLSIMFNMTFLLCLYSIYQFVGIMLDWPFIDILRTKCGYSIIPKEAAYGWVNWAGLSKLPRVWAITPEPSFWGSFLLIPISMIFPLTSRNKRWKIYMMFYILVLIITFSRSAWFGLVIIVLYNMYDLLKKRKWIIPVNNLVKIISAIIIASGICVYVTIRWHAVIEAIILMKDWSSMERLNTQVDGIMLFIRHPLIGIGWGNTPFYLKNTVTYNFYLQLLLEVGIVGFLVFGVFLLQIWKKLDSFSSKLDFSDQRDFETSKLITGLKTSFFAILIIWLNLPAYNFSYFWFVFAMMITLPKIYAKSVYENIDAKQA